MSRVTVEAPTKSRIDPKLGTDSAMNSRQRTENVLKAQRFQLKSGGINMFCKKEDRLFLTCWNIKHLLKELSRRVGDDGEGSDEVKEEHDLHQHLHPSTIHC